MTIYYVKTTGNDSTGDGSEGNPWATPGKGASMLSTGDTLAVQSGTYTLTTSTPGAGGPVVLPSNSLIRMEGYGSTFGDLGTPPVIDAGSIGSITIVKLNGNFSSKRHLVRNICVDGNSQSSVTGFGQDTGAGYTQCRLDRCTAEACTAYGFDGSDLAAHHCKAVSCNVGFRIALCSRGFAKSSTSHGYVAVQTKVKYLQCIAAGSGGDGFNHNGFYQLEWDQCISYDNAGDGFAFDGSYGMSHCFFCIATENGAYGFSWANADGVLIGCASYSNTSGRQTGVGLDLDVITLTSDPFVDATNDDFNVNTTAGAGALLRAVQLTLAP